MSSSCDSAKAMFRTHLFYSSWHVDNGVCSEENKYCLVRRYLPFVECQQNREEVKLMQRIEKCVQVHKGASKKCEGLFYQYNQKYCFTPGVEKEVDTLIDRLEGI